MSWIDAVILWYGIFAMTAFGLMWLVLVILAVLSLCDLDKIGKRNV